MKLKLGILEVKDMLLTSLYFVNGKMRFTPIRVNYSTEAYINQKGMIFIPKKNERTSLSILREISDDIYKRIGKNEIDCILKEVCGGLLTGYTKCDTGYGIYLNDKEPRIPYTVKKNIQFSLIGFESSQMWSPNSLFFEDIEVDSNSIFKPLPTQKEMDNMQPSLFDDLDNE